MKEELIVQFFNRLGYGTVVDTIANGVSYIPFLIVLWLALALIAMFYDKKNGKIVFFAVLFAIILHFIVSEGLFKHLFVDYVMRVRPYIEHPNEIIGMGYNMFRDSSFPSSHMASSLAVLTVFFSFYRNARIPIIIFILFMTFARMHMGMHYPTDVIAGAVFGLIYGMLGLWIAKKIFRK